MDKMTALLLAAGLSAGLMFACDNAVGGAVVLLLGGYSAWVARHADL